MKATIPLVALMVLLLSSAEFANNNTNERMAAAGSIRNATFMERSPNFTDLYLIQTSDKGRRILIYCNSVSCYKPRNQTTMV